jgi:hypothetical protein
VRLITARLILLSTLLLLSVNLLCFSLAAAVCVWFPRDSRREPCADLDDVLRAEASEIDAMLNDGWRTLVRVTLPGDAPSPRK